MRTDREQYTRYNAATARLLTLVKPAKIYTNLLASFCPFFLKHQKKKAADDNNTKAMTKPTDM